MSRGIPGVRQRRSRPAPAHAFKKGNPGGPGRPKGSKNAFPREFKAWLTELLQSEAYQAAAGLRVVEGKAPYLETLGAHWLHGKPTESLKVEGDANFAQMLVQAQARVSAGLPPLENNDAPPAPPAKEE